MRSTDAHQLPLSPSEYIDPALRAAAALYSTAEFCCGTIALTRDRLGLNISFVTKERALPPSVFLRRGLLQDLPLDILANLLTSIQLIGATASS